MRPQSSDPRVVAAATMFQQISPEMIKEYNAELDEYYAEYGKYLLRMNRYENWPRLLAPLNILLYSNGTAPADDVTIVLTFPDICIVQDDNERPNAPKKPDPPQKPQLSLVAGMNLGIQGYRLDDPIMAIPRFANHAPRGNIVGPKITPGDCYTVRFDIGRIKHDLPLSLPRFYMLFRSHEHAASFAIDCAIHAEKLPQKELPRNSLYAWKSAKTQHKLPLYPSKLDGLIVHNGRLCRLRFHP